MPQYCTRLSAYNHMCQMSDLLSITVIQFGYNTLIQKPNMIAYLQPWIKRP